MLIPGIKDTIAGIVNVAESAPTTVANNKNVVATAGTSVQLPTNICKSIVIKGLSSNTGIIFVGNSTVSSTNGFQLSAGDIVALDINNTNVIWIDSTVNGEGVSWLSIN